MTLCLIDLRNATDEYLWRAGHSRDAERDNPRFTEVWRIVHAPNDSDAFALRISSAREALEAFLRPKLATHLRKRNRT